MTVLVDADSCPVKDIIERTGESLGIRVVFLVDRSHVLSSRSAEVATVDGGRDAVDFALVARTKRGDVVVTQDYGVAAMVLAKGARVLDADGRVHTDATIDGLLHERWMSGRARRGGARGPHRAKRTPEDDRRFEASFRRVLAEAAGEERRLPT
jgi:uncharacterized protein YaiI (UPF0178 family)